MSSIIPRLQPVWSLGSPISKPQPLKKSSVWRGGLLTGLTKSFLEFPWIFQKGRWKPNFLDRWNSALRSVWSYDTLLWRRGSQQQHVPAVQLVSKPHSARVQNFCQLRSLTSMNFDVLAEIMWPWAMGSWHFRHRPEPLREPEPGSTPRGCTSCLDVVKKPMPSSSVSFCVLTGFEFGSIDVPMLGVNMLGVNSARCGNGPFIDNAPVNNGEFPQSKISL